MTPPAPTIQQLISAVVSDAGDDPLRRLSTASAMVRELEGVSDALLGHFVDQCRKAGHSWTDISGALGVTKQAVHKRFSPPNYTFERFTDRAKRVLLESQVAARNLNHNYLGTEHLLLGLYPPGGVGADVLTAAGVTKAKVEKRVRDAIGHVPATPTDTELPWTPRAVAALQQALTEALQLGHNYIGTEHLLLSLVHDPESLATKIVTELGPTAGDLKAAVVARLREITLAK